MRSRLSFFVANNLPEDECIKDFVIKEIMNKNRQELPIFYKLNGAIYLTYCDYIKEQKSFIGEKTFAYIMPRVSLWTLMMKLILN